MAKPITFDFTNTSDTGFYVPPGMYTAKLKSWSQEQGDKAPYIEFDFEVVGKGVNLKHRTTLKPDALFNLKNTLGALMGKEIPKQRVAIDIDKLIGRACTIEVFDDEYNGKTYSKIARCSPYSRPTEVAPSAGTPTDDLGLDDL